MGDGGRGKGILGIESPNWLRFTPYWVLSAAFLSSFSVLGPSLIRHPCSPVAPSSIYPTISSTLRSSLYFTMLSSSLSSLTCIPFIPTHLSLVCWTDIISFSKAISPFLESVGYQDKVTPQSCFWIKQKEGRVILGGLSYFTHVSNKSTKKEQCRNKKDCLVPC